MIHNPRGGHQRQPSLCALEIPLRLVPNISDQSFLLIGPDSNVAFEGLRNRHPSGHHSRVWFDHVSTLVDLFGNVECPQDSSDVEVQRLFSHVHTRTNPSTCTVGEMISVIGIGDIDVCSRRKTV